MEHASQVKGQASGIPVSLQRFFVSLAATHEQYLAIFLPSLMNFSRKGESVQLSVGPVVVGVMGEAVG